jgi:hypothetical protein
VVVRSVIGKTGVIEVDVVAVPAAPAAAPAAPAWLLKTEEGATAARLIFVEGTFECTCGCSCACTCACACAVLAPALSG